MPHLLMLPHETLQLYYLMRLQYTVSGLSFRWILTDEAIGKKRISMADRLKNKKMKVDL